MEVETIGIALLTSVIYVIIGIAKSEKFRTGEEGFSPLKASATIILGLVIGVIMYSSGIPVTEENVATQLLTYGGLLYVIENILKAIYRRIVGA